MTHMLGMDVPAAAALAQQLQHQAAAVTEVRNAVTAELSRTSWKGRDAITFIETWHGSLSGNLARASDALSTAACRLKEQIRQQESASESAGGRSGADTRGPLTPGTPGMKSIVYGDPKPDDSTSDILTEYQVSDDEMVDWDPGWGQEKVTITKGEAKLLGDLWIWEKADFKHIKDEAFDEGDRQFAPNPNDPSPQNDNHNDAFRHAYWSARLAQRFGADWASDYTTAHERIPGNQPAREAMDLYNNSVGIKIAKENPHATPEELASLIRDAVDGGEMVVMDRAGQLARSDTIPVGQTGHPDPRQPMLPGKDPVPRQESTES